MENKILKSFKDFKIDLKDSRSRIMGGLNGTCGEIVSNDTKCNDSDTASIVDDCDYDNDCTPSDTLLPV